MTTKHKLRFNTDRLLVDEWHSLSHHEWPLQDHAKVVIEILTPQVTASLPPSWQGEYTLERAQQWVSERDGESTALLAVHRSDQQAIGIVILFEGDTSGHLRLGYMLKESAWGKGFASELIGGLVDSCRKNNIKSITGGVEHGNIASSRVLEKNGFQLQPNHEASSEQMFILKLNQD